MNKGLVQQTQNLTGCLCTPLLIPPRGYLQHSSTELLVGHIQLTLIIYSASTSYCSNHELGADMNNPNATKLVAAKHSQGNNPHASVRTWLESTRLFMQIN
jgi:hypothetical protein